MTLYPSGLLRDHPKMRTPLTAEQIREVELRQWDVYWKYFRPRADDVAMPPVCEIAKAAIAHLPKSVPSVERIACSSRVIEEAIPTPDLLRKEHFDAQR